MKHWPALFFVAVMLCNCIEQGARKISRSIDDIEPARCVCQ